MLKTCINTLTRKKGRKRRKRKKKRKNLPAEQHPNKSPLRPLGALVLLISSHPSTEPMINVRRILNGMNHLNDLTQAHYQLSGKKITPN